MDGTDVCFAPVLDLDEAPKHPHNAARQTFVDVDGVVQPAPAPRFSATPGAIQGAAAGHRRPQPRPRWLTGASRARRRSKPCGPSAPL